jgi:hypothetical protein
MFKNPQFYLIVSLVSLVAWTFIGAESKGLRDALRIACVVATAAFAVMTALTL